MIIATAGHIDHGKTTLVKALTGVDTDRLPQEKARGISIDLGFAYWQTPGGATIGFVDVPGHERFVRNMLAGVCGIDCAMLVVAADDGVMPQTREHLAIIDLLGIRHGVAVITKADRVEPDRVADVCMQVRALLAPTCLADVEIRAISAATNHGVDALRSMLEEAAGTGRREVQPGRRLRHAIDRVFTVAGSGTVVTGTVFDGRVAVGDRLLLSPSGAEVRVRGIQTHGKPVAAVDAGERCAINLAGVGVDQVRRGDWLLAPQLHAPTGRLDVELRVLASEPHPIRHWTPVHLHVGTRDVTARIALRRDGAIAAGALAPAQLVLDSPIAALRGDRFILRDQSARRTLGGGRVLDPWAPRGRIDRGRRQSQLDALACNDAAEALRKYTQASATGVELAWLARAFNTDDPTLRSLLQQHGMSVIGRDAEAVVLPAAMVESVRAAIGAALGRYHRDHPALGGMEVGALHAQCAPALALPVFRALLRNLAEEGSLEFAGTLARKAGHLPVENALDLRLWDGVRPALEAAGRAGMTVAQLAMETAQKEPLLRGFLQRKAGAGELVRVPPERYFLRSTMAAFAATAKSVAAAAGDGRFSAAEFRDRCGISRALAIEVLEALDRLAVTRRVADVRLMRQDFVSILGVAQPLPLLPSTAKGDGPCRMKRNTT